MSSRTSYSYSSVLEVILRSVSHAVLASWEELHEWTVVSEPSRIIRITWKGWVIILSGIPYRIIINYFYGFVKEKMNLFSDLCNYFSKFPKEDLVHFTIKSMFGKILCKAWLCMSFWVIILAFRRKFGSFHIKCGAWFKNKVHIIVMAAWDHHTAWFPWILAMFAVNFIPFIPW